MDLIRYFMSVALLTTEQQSLPQYDTAIQTTARKYLDLQKHLNPQGHLGLNNGQFIVKPLFHIQPIYDQPFKVTFVQPIPQEREVSDYEIYYEGEQEMRRQVVRKITPPPDRVLVLLRGNPKLLLDNTYGKDIELTQKAKRLEEERGYHVELLGKTTVSLEEANEISRAYHSHSIDKNFFYRNLER